MFRLTLKSWQVWHASPEIHLAAENQSVLRSWHGPTRVHCKESHSHSFIPPFFPSFLPSLLPPFPPSFAPSFRSSCHGIQAILLLIVHIHFFNCISLCSLMAATISFLSVTAAASAALAGLGARKIYRSITAERGLSLPSLRAVAHRSGKNCAYPEDYFPGTIPRYRLRFVRLLPEPQHYRESYQQRFLSCCRRCLCGTLIWRDPLLSLWT